MTKHVKYQLKPAELKQLQLVLLDMLLELDRICKKYHIKYGIDGGTLLGAVRHRGFIPWDDDLDVVMEREEYEKFRVVAINELAPDKYFYQDHLTDPHYRWGYARIRRVDSEFVRCGQEHLKMKTGIFLDIFPRDNVPDGAVKGRLHSVYCFCLRKTLYSEVGKMREKNPFTKAVYIVLSRIPTSFVFNRLRTLAVRCNRKRTSRSRCYTFAIPRKGLDGYNSEWFTEFTEIEFEGHTFPCAKDYVGYLTCDYGDYMQLPPREKRRQHPCSKFKLPESE